ncbi:MAG: Atxe2 family lasso peptide isopeptidase, partial [Steroidobacteraceae bacterium]
IVSFGSPERAASPLEVQAYHRLTTPERPNGLGASRLIRDIAWNRGHTRAAWLESLAPRAEPGPAAPVTLFVDGRRCTAPQCTGRLGAVWWNGADVVFLRHEGWAFSVPALYVWSPDRGAAGRIYGEDSSLRSCDSAGDRLVCLQETPTTPRRIVSIRLQDGRIDTVFDPNPQFARYRLGRVEKLEVSDGFGNQAFGHLAYPPDFRAGCRYPLVIVQYRSAGFLRGGVGNEYPIFPLAAAGFLVYSSDNPDDVRLAARYDPTYWQGLAALTGKQIGASGYRMRSALGALNAAIDRLERRGIVDGSKIGITGLSAGSEALYFALTHSTRFAAAATSGLAVPQSAFLEVNGTLRAITEAEWGARSLEEAVRNASRVESLASHIDRMNTPLLIQVSDHELVSVVPDYVALLAAGKPVEAYVFPDEYHIKWHPLHKLAAADRAIDWFRFWLKGEEDPAPEKADQYVRWRELRRRASPISIAADGESDVGCPAAPGSRPDLGGDGREERR